MSQLDNQMFEQHRRSRPSSLIALSAVILIGFQILAGALFGQFVQFPTSEVSNEPTAFGLSKAPLGACSRQNPDATEISKQPFAELMQNAMVTVLQCHLIETEM